MFFLENDVLEHSEFLDVGTRVLDEFDVADNLVLLSFTCGSNLMLPLKLLDTLLDQLYLVVCGIDLFFGLGLLVLIEQIETRDESQDNSECN